ncbi:hypothetical protein B7P43_G15465, partial [Cryptotermes secundus]
SLSRTEVLEWHSRFKAGRVSVEDDKLSGRPSTSKTTENLENIRELIHEDHLRTIHELEITVIPGINTVRRVVRCGRLGFHKVCARWVPHMLTLQQKMQRMGLALQHLNRYHDEGHDMLARIVTGDESWVHHYQPETKCASMQWKHPAPLAKNFKWTPSSRKVMVTVFWDHEGILLTAFQPLGQTVNAFNGSMQPVTHYEAGHVV